MIALYTRVSTAEQALNGASIDDQVHRLTALHPTGVTYREEGCSASKPLLERPQGRALVEAIQAGLVQTVVITKLDRLFRDVVQCLTTLDQWRSRNVRLVILDFGGMAVDTETPMGRMFITMIAAFAEFERTTTAERTRTVMAYKRKTNAPGWYGDDHPARLRAQELRSSGLGCTSIARILQQEGLPTARKSDGTPGRGKPSGRWTPHAVMHLLGVV